MRSQQYNVPKEHKEMFNTELAHLVLLGVHKKVTENREPHLLHGTNQKQTDWIYKWL